MDKQRSLTKAFFDSVSEQYYERHYGALDKRRRYPSQFIRHQRILELVDDLGDKPGHVLDIGCGPGVLVCELLKRGHTVYGIDLSEKMIEKARQLVSRTLPDCLERCHLSKGSAEQLDFPDARFDIVIASGLMEYLGTDELFLRECSRVLKPAGKAIISFRNRLFNAFSGNAYTKQASNSSDLIRITNELVAAFREQSDAITPQMMLTFATGLAGVNDRVPQDLAQVETNPGNWEYTMQRRQHTPGEVADQLSRVGMKLDRIIFWHFHPFPPPVVNRFPALCIEIGLAMEVFGETPIGALMASGFLVRAVKA